MASPPRSLLGHGAPAGSPDQTALNGFAGTSSKRNAAVVGAVVAGPWRQGWWAQPRHFRGDCCPASGTWCSGITSASHAEGPGFKSQCVHAIHRDGFHSISPPGVLMQPTPPPAIGRGNGGGAIRAKAARHGLSRSLPSGALRGKGPDAETRDRTGDLQIFSLTLSQLSYRGLLMAVACSFAPRDTPRPTMACANEGD